ncbi:EKC/KEOPS complex subunit like protein, partial [Verticillium longisporum]
MLDTIALDLVPSDHQVHVALFRGVQNAGFLHSQLLARNAAFEYAFIDASVVASRNQILAAAFRALAAKLSDNLKTPNVHSELVTSLSPSNNIADAYRRFGISPTTKDLVVVKITYPSDSAPTPVSRDDIEKHLAENVEATPAEFSDDELAVSTDWTKVKKYYKLNGLPWLDAIKDEQERKLQMDELVLGAMALRGVRGDIQTHVLECQRFLFINCILSFPSRLQTHSTSGTPRDLGPHGIPAGSRPLHS